MIRFFVLVGIVGGLAIAYLATYQVGPITQRPPTESLLTGFRAEGNLPESASLEMDETAEELGVFEVPEKDEEMLDAAIEAMGDMPGMNMDGMDMSGADSGTMTNADGTTMDMSNADSGTMTNADGTTMDMTNADGTTMDMSNADSGTMTNADGTTMDMSNADSGTMTNADGTTMDMSNADGGTMTNADGTTMDMSNADGGAMDMAGGDEMAMGEGGLLITEDGSFDREISLEMAEWKFSEMQIDVKMGERIKFTVRNGGQIPHEFMFMSPALMQAVDYRATRADWSLFEHEALYERALVLPGGEFSFVLQVQQPGSWMFMCMLPYHMQMGMMGQMATEGMAMDMDM